jgi:hypothetical protein
MLNLRTTNSCISHAGQDLSRHKELRRRTNDYIFRRGQDIAYNMSKHVSLHKGIARYHPKLLNVRSL